MTAGQSPKLSDKANRHMRPKFIFLVAGNASFGDVQIQYSNSKAPNETDSSSFMEP